MTRSVFRLLLVASLLSVVVEAQAHSEKKKRFASMDNRGSVFEDKELLELISPDQLEAYLKGAPSSGVFLLSGESLEQFLAEKGGPSYELIWASVGASTQSSGGDFDLENSTKAFAGVAEAAGLKLTVGFIPIREESSEVVFEDGFETGDTTRWNEAGDVEAQLR